MKSFACFFVIILLAEIVGPPPSRQARASPISADTLNTVATQLDSSNSTNTWNLFYHGFHLGFKLGKSCAKLSCGANELRTKLEHLVEGYLGAGHA